MRQEADSKNFDVHRIVRSTLLDRLSFQNYNAVVDKDAIVFMKFGSKLYGSNVATSDDDYRGVFLPASRELLLGKAPSGITTSTRKNQEGHKNGPQDVDLEFYSLYRFLELVGEGQTVAFDMLFTPPSYILAATPTWSAVQSIRKQLLNKRCGASIGYARAQADRYSLRGDRMKALENIIERLRPHYERDPRQLLGDVMPEIVHSPEALVQSWEPAQREFVKRVVDDSKHLPGGAEYYLKICGKAAGCSSSVKQAYELWKKRLDAYGERARLAREGGADWKAMYHAVRVYHEAVELLTTHTVTFPRPEAELLLKIRRGEFAPQQVSEMIEEGIRQVLAAQEASTLPWDTDAEIVDAILIKCYGRKLKYSNLLAGI